MPAAVGKFPITRANLNNNTNVTTGIDAIPEKPSGWYIDLELSGNNIAIGRRT
ncbi:hypothetical protein [Collimonas pratensis]|uniref:Uncharacterized protein n=1 Tax=Collimonas pratensis TaxID=279113 RepID=A0A127QAF3_9BURK|nr:hypothetical protein [Collimonas pratensis]AMP06966.1 hypothetical protein CPter91_4667 [Collimonas pratensis]